MTIRDRSTWRAYVQLIESGTEIETLNEERLREHFGQSQGARLTSRTTIEGSSAAGVILKLPGGDRTIRFHEIIAADTVLRHWLSQGLAPNTGTKGDFRHPVETIGVRPISECYYAPTLAERFRRSAPMVAGPG